MHLTATLATDLDWQLVMNHEDRVGPCGRFQHTRRIGLELRRQSPGIHAAIVSFSGTSHHIVTESVVKSLDF
jgi:hypothetical protein